MTFSRTWAVAAVALTFGSGMLFSESGRGARADAPRAELLRLLPGLNAGDEAFRNGDYRNAERLYRQALEKSAPGGEERFAASCALIRVALAKGDVPSARTRLDELDKAYPAARGELTLLAAEVLSAEGRDKEVAALTAPEKFSDAERLKLNSLKLAAILRAGDFAGALSLADELEKMPGKAGSGAMEGRLLGVYARIMGNQLPEAGKKLDQLDVEPGASAFASMRKKLRLLLNVKEKKLAETNTAAEALAKENGSRPDALLFAAFLLAAENSEAAADYKTAVSFLETAAGLAPTVAERRTALARLINVCLLDARRARAADACELLLSTYPAKAPERGELLLRGARLRAENDQVKTAFVGYNTILRDRDLALDVRLAAARESAALAFKNGDTAKGNAMLSYILENGGTPDERQEGNFLLGEAAYRAGNYTLAAEYFTKSATSEKWHDRGLFWSIQSLLRSEDSVGALDAAESLSASKDPDFAASGAFYRALLLEKLRRAPEALAAYRKFIAESKQSNYLREAKFNIARLCSESGLYAEAARNYADFAESFKADPAAPEALYRAHEAAFLSGGRNLMGGFLERLLTGYPKSEYTPAAAFAETDVLCGEHREAEALALLDRLEKSRNDFPAETAAQLQYERGRILNARRKQYEALKVLDALILAYPQSLRCADALFLAGNIHSDLGEYAKAAECYRRAGVLRPTGEFAELCDGRVADVYLSGAALKTDDKQLAEAQALYLKLSKSSNPLIAAQSYYKAGKCAELAGDTEKALAIYDEILYNAVAAKRAKQIYPTEWAAKAAYSACSLYLADGTMASAHEALRVLRLYRSLGLDTGEDFNAMERKIRDKYRL